MKITVLGSSSATPTIDRYPSSQILTVEDSIYMIDCGEGTQFRLNHFKIKKNKIDAIFISHLHGDHCYGLIGLLTSMSMHERTHKLIVVAPEGLKEIIELQCKYSSTIIRFEIEYIVFNDIKPTKVYSDNSVTVTTLPLKHKITTCGFLFEKKYPEYSIDKDKIKLIDIPNFAIKTLKEGKDWIDDQGHITHSQDYTIKNTKSKKFAYCSDNMYHEELIPLLKNIDLLYHEATFLDVDIERALFTKHSTAKQAGEIALKAEVKQLMIGHYSARYPDIGVLLEESKSVFENSILAIEGQEYEI